MVKYYIYAPVVDSTFGSVDRALTPVTPAVGHPLPSCSALNKQGKKNVFALPSFSCGYATRDILDFVDNVEDYAS
jgi:hypothetical protein